MHEVTESILPPPGAQLTQPHNCRQTIAELLTEHPVKDYLAYGRKLIGIGFVLFFVLATGPASAATQVKAVQVAVSEDRTRIVLESNNLIRFSLFSLRNPERLLLDLEGVDIDSALKDLGDKISAHPYIQLTSLKPLKGDRVRIELDLSTEVQSSVSNVKPEGTHEYQLILDIYPEQSRKIALSPSTAQEQEIAAPGESAIAATEKAGDTSASIEELLLSIRINAEDHGTVFILRQNGRLLVSGNDLQRWRIRLPNIAPITHNDEAFYPLDALRGLSYQMDESSLTLVMQATPSLFDTTALKGTVAGFTVPTPSPPGGFLNYDVTVTDVRDQTAANGLFELGFFNSLGTGISNFVARNHSTTAEADIIRLDTTWTQDRPMELASLRLGDTISSAGSFGRPVRLGGVQWATNFATQPGFITFPLPGLSGEAVLPSTLDLYVNDALRLHRDVPTGPFSIQDLPVVTGMGEARLVVRDLLGREQIISQPFYASPRLLQQGLHDYSYEIGAVRENFGLVSNDYGRLVAVGTHRFGFTDRLTGEMHGEVLSEQQTLGLGGAMLWSDIGVFSASAAASNSERGSGILYAAGFERQSRRWGVGGNIELASEDFAQLGLQQGQLAPKQRSQAFISLSTGRYGSVGLSYTYQDFRDRPDIELVSANYNYSLGQYGFLNFSLLRFLGEDARTSAGLSYTIPFGTRTTASANINVQQDNAQQLLQLQRSLPVGSGVGYRLLAGAGDSDVREAGISLQNDIGTYGLEAAQTQGETAYRASARGGLALLGGDIFLSRSITDSFAVVRVPDYPNVRIYADNQVATRTNAAGNALLPRLRPYQNNPVRIEQADLPLDAQIDTVQLNASPYFRSGLLLEFPVKRSRGALITVNLENGEPLPAGAFAKIKGGQEEFPVGLRGELYLSGLASHNQLQIIWNDQSCELEIAFPETEDPLPHLGTYICPGLAHE